MSKCNPEHHHIETTSALDRVVAPVRQERHAAYVGMGVHKETNAVAVAEPGSGEPLYRGEIANKPKNVEKLAGKPSESYGDRLLLFCYEAGPCGYVLYRQLLACGHDCQVVAPSKIAKTPGERIKTDRCDDALKLARLLRSGDLTPVWVPDRDQEMIACIPVAVRHEATTRPITATWDATVSARNFSNAWSNFLIASQRPSSFCNIPVITPYHSKYDLVGL